MPLAFNRRSERQNFIYRHNPAQPGSFLILRLDPARGGYDPVGVYMKSDAEEAFDITERRLTNIIMTLNGDQDDVLRVSHLTGKRLLYTMVTDAPDIDRYDQVVFRSHDGKGVSKETAVLKIKKGVFNEN
jgi:hypothetical protein